MIRFLSHDLHVEFPDLAERVDNLRVSNTHFASVYDQYGALDGEIIDAEQGIRVVDDFSLEDLKKRRLRLKDELYGMLRAS